MSNVKITSHHSEKFSNCADSDFDFDDLLCSAGNNEGAGLTSFRGEPQEKLEDVSLDFLLNSLGPCKAVPEKKDDPAKGEDLDLQSTILDSLVSDCELKNNKNDFSLCDLYLESKVAEPIRESHNVDFYSLFLEPNDSVLAVTQGAEGNLEDFLLTDILGEQNYVYCECRDPSDFGENSTTFTQKSTPGNDYVDQGSVQEFTLADIYISSRDRNDSLSSGHSSLSDSSTEKPFFGETQKLSDSDPESGYSSEKDKPSENHIDLSEAKNIVGFSVPHHETLESLIDSHKCTEAAIARSKPSLFFKTLCCRMKPNDSFNSIVPKSLEEHLEKMDYWKYFSFDTPSPDDVVKESQRNVRKDV